MFHFGMPTLLEFETLEDNAKFCKVNQLEFVEINMNMPEYQVEALDPIYLRNLMKRYGIYFTFHMADNMDIANFQKEVRDVNTLLVQKTLEFAESIGSPIVNMHMHIHDAVGVDHHLALGSGEMALNRYIGFARNYHIRCVIEAKTIAALQESVDILPKYLAIYKE